MSTELKEIVFRGVLDATPYLEDWLGVANALDDVQLSHLTRIHFCSLENPRGEALKTFLRNKMVQCDTRGVIEFR